MDLRGYVKLFRRRLPSILLCTAIGVALALAYTLHSPKVYTARTQLFVGNQAAESTQQLSQANSFTQARVQSYVSIVDTVTVLGPVVDDLDLGISAQALAGHVTASAPTNRVLIEVAVSYDNGRDAAEIANAVAAQFKTVIEDLEKTSADAPSPIRITITEPAFAPSSPSSPDPLRNLLLGLVAGLVIGAVQAVVRELLDTTVKTPEEAQEALDGLSIIGAVPIDRRAVGRTIAMRDDPHSSRSEAYRQLRANLQFVDIDNPPKIIAVTSAMAGEGKSTTAINLAASLAEAGAKVCLVDADLRRPTIAKSLGLVGDVGFTTVLIGQADLSDVLQNAAQNFAVLASGPIPPNPTEVLLTEHARQVIQELAAVVDYVIIDTAPLVPVVDGAQVAAMSDATVMVVRAGRTTRDQMSKGLGVLRQLGVRPVGAVLNLVPRGGGRTYGYGYYSDYAPGTQPATSRTAEVPAVRLDDVGGTAQHVAPAAHADADDHGVRLR